MSVEEKRIGNSFMIDTSTMTRVNDHAVADNTPDDGDGDQDTPDDDLEDDDSPNDGTDDLGDGDALDDDSDDDDSDDDDGDGGDSSQDDDSDDDDDGEDDDINAYFHLSKELHKDGFLPQDFEIADDISGPDVYSAYKDKLRSDLEPSIRQEVMETLSKQGINEHDILMGRALREGVNPSLLSAAGSYQMYSQLPDDSNDSDKESVIRAMYQDRGFDSTEAEAQIAAAKSSEDEAAMTELFGRGRKYFGEKYRAFVDNETKRAKELEDSQRIAADKSEQTIKNVIRERKVLDMEISKDLVKEFHDGIYNASEIIDLEGGKVQVTPLQKFLLEFQSNDEMKLYLFHNWMFKDKVGDKIKKAADRKAESDFLSAYEKRTIKRKKSKNSKRTPKKAPAPKKGNQYFIGFSGNEK